MSNESSIYQAIQHAKEGNPSEMQNSLGAAIGDKVSDAINLKKIAIAGNLFNNVPETTEGEENEEGTNG